MSRFKNGIFISYSHADNLGGWVNDFHTHLQNNLIGLGVDTPIWRDNKLNGVDAFSDEILDQLKTSALLVSLLSPNGMRSNWCEKERQRFEQYAESNGGFRVGNSARAFKVVITPANGDAHRSVFGTLGYEFFERDRQTGRIDHYQPGDPKFRKRMDALAQDIRDQLQIVEAAVPQPLKPVVYVAEVSADVEPDRNKIVDQLLKWGYRVAPSDPLPINGSGLRGAIQETLKEAVVSVHFVSDKRGAIPAEEEKSILALQYELANAKGIERIVWVLPNTTAHESFNHEIEVGSAIGLERLEGSRTVEDVKEILAAKLNSLSERPRSTSRNDQRLNVYVVCDQKDHPFAPEPAVAHRALELHAFLDQQGFCVWLPPVDMPDPRERDKDHRETLKMSDAVILYWGAADEAWFRNTIRELTKTRSTTRRNRPFIAEALYFSTPLRPQKNQYRRYLDIVVEQSNGFSPEALRPFLERLQRAGEAGVP